MNKPQIRKSGVAVLEFLFAAPAFFILVFFVIEIALIWNDRHIMRLAAYRAARTVVKTRASQNYSGPLCWATPQSGGVVDAQSEQTQTAARRSASKIMATITPSVTQILTSMHFSAFPNGQPLGAPIDLDIANRAESAFGDTVQTVANNPYVHAAVRYMKGLTGAWVFTDLRCQNVEYPATSSTKKTNGVEVTLVYHRSAKMPYIGNLMWTLRRLQDFAKLHGGMDDGTSGPILRVNPLNYGIEFDYVEGSPEMAAASENLRDLIKEEAGKIGERVASKIEDIHQDLPVPGSPDLGDSLPKIFSETAGIGFDKTVAEINSSLTQATINHFGNKLLELFLRAPNEIKTIAVTVSVRVPNFNQAYVNNAKSWNGNALLVGAFTDDKNMSKLAKQLGLTLDQDEIPNKPPRSLPLTDNSKAGNDD